MRCRLLALAVLSLACSFANAQYLCEATAEAYGEKMESYGAYEISFTVTPDQCPVKCYGWINYKVVYVSKTGRLNKTRRQVVWRSQENEPVDVVVRGAEEFCGVAMFESNYCQMRDTEMIKVSCTNRQ